MSLWLKHPRQSSKLCAGALDYSQNLLCWLFGVHRPLNLGVVIMMRGLMMTSYRQMDFGISLPLCLFPTQQANLHPDIFEVV